MDSEEFEQIPWSSLTMDQSQPVDRRLYMAIGVVGVVVAAIFGARLLGGAAPQPIPPEAVAPQAVITAAETTSTSGLVVSEADLMAASPVEPVDNLGLSAVAFAEWFVTDYYTTDGSPETSRSVTALFADSAGNPQLPHSMTPPPAVTYVEWARSTRLRLVGDGGVEVDVVYRTITESEEGFVRNPVRAVTVTMDVGSSDPGISGPPVEIAVPAIGG